jgi:ABC-2 type transport system permease protein
MTLQSILGSNYKWFYVTIFYYKTHITYLKDTSIRAFAEFFSLVSTIFIWRITTQDNLNFDSKEITTYLIIGFIYTGFTTTWFAEDLGNEIKNGKLSTSLLRPTSKFLHNFFEYVGRGVLAEILTTFLPAMLVLPFIIQYLTIPTFGNLIFTILFIPISFFIRHNIEIIFGCFSFWLVNFGGVLTLKYRVTDILDGSKIPLNILARFLPFVLFSPFAFLLHYPVQIYFGKFDLLQISQTYLGGLSWCIVLFIIS